MNGNIYKGYLEGVKGWEHVILANCHFGIWMEEMDCSKVGKEKLLFVCIGQYANMFTGVSAHSNSSRDLGMEDAGLFESTDGGRRRRCTGWGVDARRYGSGTDIKHTNCLEMTGAGGIVWRRQYTGDGEAVDRLLFAYRWGMREITEVNWVFGYYRLQRDSIEKPADYLGREGIGHNQRKQGTEATEYIAVLTPSRTGRRDQQSRNKPREYEC